MNLKKTAEQKWYSGDFYRNDDEVETTSSLQINTLDYIDMTPLGNTLQNTPQFEKNATDQEKAGAYSWCYIMKPRQTI